MLWSLTLLGLLSISAGLNLPGVPIDFNQPDEVLSAISAEIAQQFADEYVNFLQTGVESAKLRQLSTQLSHMHSEAIVKKEIAELGAADQFLMCTTCRASVNVFARMYRADDGELHNAQSKEQTKKGMLGVCQRMDIQTPEVCDAIFELYWPFAEYIGLESLADSRTVCGILPISFCKVKQKEFNWSLNIDKNGPAINAPKDDIPAKSANDLKILQLTDIHYDPNYKPGSLAVCKEALCCQKTPAGGVEAGSQAGYWSDYRDCDTPLHMIENAFEHIKQQHSKIDYLYYTGDIVPHNGWETTRESNKAIISKVNGMIKQTFAGIPVYPILGNHESHPTNVFGAVDMPDEISAKWLYEHLWEEWQQWLPASAKQTVLAGGYYTLVPKTGFRIIALNNMDGYLYNFWIYNDGRVAVPQLQWLHDTLLAAEKAGEYVHILMHIPTGNSDFWSVWAREFNRVLERYSHIVSGIFTGHTHKDEMAVHYSAKGHAIGITWNGGSLTTYSYKNPNYRIYDVEPKSSQVVDHETWISNLTLANSQGAEVSPVWYKEYQFSSAFTDKLSPAGIDALLEKMTQNPEILKQYWEYKVTSADPRLQQGCDNSCLLGAICGLATTDYNDKKRCRELQAKLKVNLPEDDTTTTTQTPTKSTTEEDVTAPAPTTPEDDGAVAISALKLTTILGFFLLAKFLL